MSDDEDVQRQQLESMTTEEITAHIQENQREINIFIQQLASRAYVQQYTEQQYNELLTLLQESLTFIEGLSPFPLEWIGRRNELIVKLKRKV